MGSGFNMLGNVNVKGSGDGDAGINGQESYFFAETLKYAFLMFGGDGPWQVGYQGGNQFVLNTEGHPLKVVS
jgi:mannosyl-oligosaccharide alpha-1,2-mannosidase